MEAARNTAANDTPIATEGSARSWPGNAARGAFPGQLREHDHAAVLSH
ncbi:hypothetical protein C7S13_3886 [Burkholderia cepacia]|nr:hypothetical protein [Burkholderia cepacia]